MMVHRPSGQAFIVLWVLLLWGAVACSDNGGGVYASPDARSTAALPDAGSAAFADLSTTELEERTVALIDNRNWVLSLESEDPWASTRSRDADQCPESRLEVETIGDELWFDVITRDCAYVTVEQPLLEDVPQGASLALRIWHFRIDVGEGDFVLAFQLGQDDAPLWQTQRPVPSESGLIYEVWQAPRAMAKGERLLFHLSNHGSNSWSVIDFVATW